MFEFHCLSLYKHPTKTKQTRSTYCCYCSESEFRIRHKIARNRCLFSTVYGTSKNWLVLISTTIWNKSSKVNISQALPCVVMQDVDVMFPLKHDVKNNNHALGNVLVCHKAFYIFFNLPYFVV
jgi:hypothetical protein